MSFLKTRYVAMAFFDLLPTYYSLFSLPKLLF